MPERQLGSLRSVIDNIRRDGGKPSVESIATHLSSMHTTQRAPVLLALQRTHGNQYVQRVVSCIQAKLKVGQPGDKYEQEADRVADAVMRLSEQGVQRQLEPEKAKEEELEAGSATRASTLFVYDSSRIPIHTNAHTRKNIQPKLKVNFPGDIYEQEADRVADQVLRQEIPEEEQTQNVEIQAKGASGDRDINVDLKNRLNRSKGGGSPLSRATRSIFEPRMQHDFSKVRVHTDNEAVQMNQKLGAQAFTHRRDIYFGAGQYNPQSTAGKRLIAHELTHVVQQTLRATSSHEGVFREEAAEPPDAAEVSQRQTILDDMTRDMTIPDTLRDQIVDAMRAFSINQLETMQRHGVLLWWPRGVPPRFELPAELVDRFAPLGAPAAYYPTLRLIRIREDLTVSPLRHELAHAWDYTRGLQGRGQRPIYDLTPAEQEGRVRTTAASGRSEQSWSEGSQRHRIRAGESEERLTMVEMFNRYNRRLERSGRRDAVTFDSGAQQGHSRISVQEFYAEGYNTFHGIDEIAQARLLNYAPELFRLLQSEAASEGLSAPDESRLQTLIQHNCHIPTFRADPVCTRSYQP